MVESVEALVRMRIDRQAGRLGSSVRTHVGKRR